VFHKVGPDEQNARGPREAVNDLGTHAVIFFTPLLGGVNLPHIDGHQIARFCMLDLENIPPDPQPCAHDLAYTPTFFFAPENIDSLENTLYT